MHRVAVRFDNGYETQLPHCNVQLDDDTAHLYRSEGNWDVYERLDDDGATVVVGEHIRTDHRS